MGCPRGPMGYLRGSQGVAEGVDSSEGVPWGGSQRCRADLSAPSDVSRAHQPRSRPSPNTPRRQVRGPSDGPSVFRHSVAGHRATAAPVSGPWSPPDGLRPHTFEPIGAGNGWHAPLSLSPGPHGWRACPPEDPCKASAH